VQTTEMPASVARAPRVSVVIVAHNSLDDLRQCLTEFMPPEANSPELEVTVVDNASSDDIQEVVRREFPAARYLLNPQNEGFAKGANRGIRSSTGRHILVLNPDVRIRPDAIEKLSQRLDSEPRAGLLAPKLLNPDGSVQYSCRTFYDLKTLLLRRSPLRQIFPRHPAVRRHLMMDWDHATVRDVDWVIGGCVMLSREVLDEVGLFDERYFLYFEDVDFCYRLHRHGYAVLYEPGIAAIHEHKRASAGGVLKLAAWAHAVSMLRFFAKWGWRPHREPETAS
jgi:N-acetylglucosaminyl-diphospho-decaprenol L-rhamnosyltransferase